MPQKAKEFFRSLVALQGQKFYNVVMSQSSPTTESGHIFIVVRLPGPPPPSRYAITVLEKALDGGLLSVSYSTDMRLLGRLFQRGGSADNTLAEVISCPVTNPHDRPCLLEVVWEKHRHLEIRVNNQCVASNFEVATRATKLIIPEKSEKEIDVRDFTRENNNARQKRKDTAFGAMGQEPRRNLVRMDPDYMFEALQNESRLLRDNVARLANGQPYYQVAIMRALRTIVAKEEPLPLLQFCAAHLNAPLIVYTFSDPSVLPPVKPDQHMCFDIATRASETLPNPIDLDVWMNEYCGRTPVRSFTHKELLLAIANTTASHVRRDIDHRVPMLRELHSRFSGDFDSDGLTEFVRQLAIATADLAEALVLKYQSDRPTGA